MGDDRYWLIGIAAPPQEAQTAARLIAAGIEIYLPIAHKQQRAGRGRLRDVAVPLLRPYFFVPAHITDAQFILVRHAPGVRGFLELDGRPAVLAEAELSRLRSHEARLEAARRQRIAERGQGPHFMIGEAVEIAVGFARLKGAVHALHAGARAAVKLEDGMTLFGRDVIEVALTHLAPARG